MAGFVAVRIGRSRPSTRPAVILAAIVGTIAAVSMVAEWRAGSVWSELSVIFVAVPARLVGGILAARRGLEYRQRNATEH